MSAETISFLITRVLLWGSFVAILVSTILLAVAAGWTVAGPWWPTTLVQNSYRRRRSCWALLHALAAATTPMLIIGDLGVGVGTLVFLLFAPKYVNWRVRSGAWKDDGEAIRTGAWTIRNRLRERREEPLLPQGAGPWPEYVNDVVRAARDHGYRPPETVIPGDVIAG